MELHVLINGPGSYTFMKMAFGSATLIRTWGFVGVGMRIENAEYTDLTIIKFAYLVREIIKSVY